MDRDAVAAGGRLRVLFATRHSYLPQRAGGLESSTHDLCLELAAGGDRPAVLAMLETGGLLSLGNRIKRRVSFGRRFPADRRMGYPVYRGWTPERGVEEVVGRHAPHVVVVQGNKPIPLVRAVLELGIPAALYVRDVEFHRLGGTIPPDRRLLVLANSGFTAGRARQELGVDARVFPPLVRPDAYRVPAPGDRVLFVNPHPDKGVEIAFALAEARSDIPFLFVESWPLPDDLRRVHRHRAASLPNVEWSEPVGDMRSVYARARIVLAPSLWEEAWGRIATEAQVSGIPVLASEHGGLPESVGPGGLLVDPGAPIDEWAGALSRLWDDPETYARLSAAAVEHARRPDIQPAALVGTFRRLLAEHAAAT